MRMLEHVRQAGQLLELANVIERSTNHAPGPFIEPRHLPPTLADEPVARTSRRSRSARHDGRGSRAAADLMTLEHTRDNKTRAAEILGISLKTLHNKLNKLDCVRKSTRDQHHAPRQAPNKTKNQARMRLASKASRFSTSRRSSARSWWCSA
jgi:DNA-binding NtrC family response regulator